MIKTFERFKKTAQRMTLTSLAAVLLVAAPAPVYVYAGEDDCSPVATAPTGIQKPSGADAGTYTYNSCTGLWENPHYTWNPSTKDTTPKETPVYTYNDTSGKWDTQQWHYSPAQETWYQSTVSVTTPPAGADTVGGPKAAESVSNNSNPTPGDNQSVDNSNTTGINDTTNASVTNAIGSTALSGSASVIGNTVGGSALSGSAQSIANVMNLLQSSSSLGSNAATFVANIDGDVQGDLVIDPNALQPAVTSVNNTNNIDVNLANNGQITNDLTLNAASGAATVADNNRAGNATSGNAEAVADVVNMIDSMISSNQSFLGVVNINGNFNGNILMPESFLDSLIASNAPHSDVSISQNTVNNVAANITNNSSIANNVKSTAASGSASVAGNTNAGSATTGNAKTNVTIFDLTGVQVTGGNTMLVFVNVLGKWVGVLMNAPAGSTAAAFGGGITSATTNDTNNATLNATNTGKITNNIDATAFSGDATVTHNTNAGNATSGDAETAVNLNNITNSSLNLTGWFGILFINVFGNWNGNFGVATTQDAAAVAASAGTTPAAPVFGFVPKAASHKSTTGTGSGSSSSTGSSLDAQLASVVQEVKGASTASASATPKAMQAAVAQDKNQSLIIGIGLFLVGMLILAAEQIRSRLSPAK